jgi:hypothetical protein
LLLMLNHLRTKLLDHDSYKRQAHLGRRKQSTGSEGDRARNGRRGDTLLFLVELQPSLIVSWGQGNTTLMQKKSPGSKLLPLLRKWAGQQAEGPRKKGWRQCGHCLASHCLQTKIVIWWKEERERERDDWWGWEQNADSLRWKDRGWITLMLKTNSINATPTAC